MPATYEPIASTTLGTAANTVTLGSGGTLPQSYTDLICVISGTLSAVDNVYVRFNGDSSNSYSYTVLAGSGSTATSYRASNIPHFPLDYYEGLGNTNPGTIKFHMLSYSNTNTNKTSLSEAAAAETGGGVSRNVCLWRSNSAITSITFYAFSSNFASGTTFSLYGIKAAV